MSCINAKMGALLTGKGKKCPKTEANKLENVFRDLQYTKIWKDQKY